MFTKAEGLSDPHLGTTDKKHVCATCYESNDICPGHWGRIELAAPVFHFGIVQSNMACPS